MIITKKAIPRRAVLRGLGVSLALPFLDGMVPALTAMRNTAANPVRRLGAVYVPNGMMMNHWDAHDRGHRLRLPADPQAARAVPPIDPRALGGCAAWLVGDRIRARQPASSPA